MHCQGLDLRALLLMTRNEIRKADKVIFPGVGEAGSAMKYLKDRGAG